MVQYGGSGFGLGTSNFSQGAELAATYSRLATARPFLDRVRQHSTFVSDPTSLGSVSASRDSNPPTLIIKVRHRDPVSAAMSAQVVAEEFIDYVIERRLGEIARRQTIAAAQGVANIADLTAAQFVALDSLSLLDPEVPPPGEPVVPRTRQNTILGVILGLALALGGAILLESLRDTVRFAEQLTRRFGVPSLGVVFKWSSQDIDEGSLIISDAPDSSYAESLRQIRANLQFTTANQPGQVLLVTSPGPGEGKSTLLCNLAIAFGTAGKRTVIVDGDLRRPSMHSMLRSVAREPGLSNYLAALEPDLRAILHPSEKEGVWVIPSGPTPPNSAELLGSPSMSTLIEQLRDEFDLVFIDSPPLLVVADGPLLASQSDGVIVIVDGFATRSASLRASLDALRNAQANVLGVVINKLKRPRFGYGYGTPYYYAYQSYYRYYGGDEVSVNGTGRLFNMLAGGPKRVWSLFRRR